jgi:hypothetical protein
MKILFLIIFQIVIFLKNIKNDIVLPPCNQNNIGKYFSVCQEMKQNGNKFKFNQFLVYFYWIENCNNTDPLSLQLPMSIQGINCTNCEKGSVIDYSFSDKKVICTTCPSNTYSLGNTFRIDGRLNEWTNSSSTLGQFSNLCYIEKNNGDIVEEGCQLFKATGDKNYIYADSNGDTGASSYYAELSIGLQFVKKGKVKINFMNNS